MINKNQKNELEKEEQLDQVEEELIKEEMESRKQPMPVSGRSVFEIKRIRERDTKKKN